MLEYFYRGGAGPLCHFRTRLMQTHVRSDVATAILFFYLSLCRCCGRFLSFEYVVHGETRVEVKAKKA